VVIASRRKGVASKQLRHAHKHAVWDLMQGGKKKEKAKAGWVRPMFTHWYEAGDELVN
jgi:hypothetical protein